MNPTALLLTLLSAEVDASRIRHLTLALPIAGYVEALRPGLRARSLEALDVEVRRELADYAVELDDETRRTVETRLHAALHSGYRAADRLADAWGDAMRGLGVRP